MFSQIWINFNRQEFWLRQVFQTLWIEWDSTLRLPGYKSTAELSIRWFHAYGHVAYIRLKYLQCFYGYLLYHLATSSYWTSRHSILCYLDACPVDNFWLTWIFSILMFLYSYKQNMLLKKQICILLKKGDLQYSINVIPHIKVNVSLIPLLFHM